MKESLPQLKERYEIGWLRNLSCTLVIQRCKSETGFRRRFKGLKRAVQRSVLTSKGNEIKYGKLSNSWKEIYMPLFDGYSSGYNFPLRGKNDRSRRFSFSNYGEQVSGTEKLWGTISRVKLITQFRSFLNLIFFAYVLIIRAWTGHVYFTIFLRVYFFPPFFPFTTKPRRRFICSTSFERN